MKKTAVILFALSFVFILFIAGCAQRPARNIVSNERDYAPSTTISSQAIAQQSSPQAVDATIDAQLSQLINQETDLTQLERELII